MENITSSNFKQELRNKLGVTHVMGGYNFNKKLPFLLEGSEEINRGLGCKNIKLWLSSEYAKTYSFNHNWQKYDNLVEIVDSEYYRDILLMDFKTICFEVLGFDEPNFHSPISDKQFCFIYDEMYSLVCYLLKKYAGSGKNFILQNWEGDNMATGSNRIVPNELTYINLENWLNIRTKAISDAKKRYPSKGVNVFSCIEINKISTGKYEKLIDRVIPKTSSDLYSYSNWETKADKALLRANLNKMRLNCPPSDTFGNKNLMVGEFGGPENEYSEEEIFLLMKNQLEVYIEYEMQYIFFWQLYCNEFAHEKTTGRPDNGDMRGFWLRRPDGSYTKTYKYLKTFFTDH